MSTRRMFLKSSGAILAAAASLKVAVPDDPTASIDWHVTVHHPEGDRFGRAHVTAHATWAPRHNVGEWSGAMTVNNDPKAIAWAKGRLSEMLLRAYHAA